MLRLLKNQKKGYVLLETLVVVGILSIVLVGMYSSFISLYSVFKESRTYDNTEYLYKTKVLREQLAIDADLGSQKIITVCNNNDSSNKCSSHAEYGSVFRELDVQYAFLAKANITTGDVNGMTSIPVTIKRYIRDLDTDADDTDIILIVAYKINDPGYEIASINYSKTQKGDNYEFYKVTSGLDSTTNEEITKPAPSGASCTNTLAYDGTVDNNLRYIGADPCNYVSFNNEIWRIIGIMNNVDDGTGKKESRIKIRRKDSLGEFSWDTSNSSTNTGYGINDWTGADLKSELNGDYLNTSLTANTNWYNGQNNRKTGVFDYTKRLNAEAQGLIGNTKWNLGGHNSSAVPASTLYTTERGNVVWGNGTGTCNDGLCPRSTSWTGKVALMYPSDYGYAVGGTVRSVCLEKNLSKYDEDDCYINDWLYINRTSYQLLLTPYSNHADTLFFINYSGNILANHTSINYAVYPVTYLKAGVLISGGNGSLNNPYTLI